MASNARYHRVPEEMRPSMESTGNADLDALLIDPLTSDDEDNLPKKEHRFTCYPTFFLRLLSVCVFIPSFVLLIVGNRKNSIPAIVFICFALIRNSLVVLYHIFSKHIRLRLEFRNRRSVRSRKPGKSLPAWLKHGRLHLLFDMVLLLVLFIMAILATQGLERYRWYYGERTSEITAGCILAFIGILAYALSLPDLGKPSNLTISGGISFSYCMTKRAGRPEQPQTYRDVEATSAMSIQPRKTGTDSPVAN